jgi:16S rRNA (guanine527-N7)-methyltransferase
MAVVSFSPEGIARSAAAVGVVLEPEAAAALSAHLSMVVDAASSLNLVSEKTLQDALRLHVIDSLMAVPFVCSPGSLADLGSGAGYPGIPVGVATGARTYLIESRSKRARFLRSVLDGLADYGVEGEVVHARAESAHAIERVGGADLTMARAVSGLATLIELAAPLTRMGGVFVAYKGRLETSELERGDRAAVLVGMERRNLERLELPGVGEVRHLVFYRRVGPPSTDLPRREGRAAKSPLG